MHAQFQNTGRDNESYRTGNEIAVICLSPVFPSPENEGCNRNRYHQKDSDGQRRNAVFPYDNALKYCHCLVHIKLP